MSKFYKPYLYLLFALFFFALFWHLALFVLSGAAVPLDTNAHWLFSSHRSVPLDAFMLSVTDFGNIYTLSFLGLILLLFLVHRKKTYRIFLLLLSMPLIMLAVDMVKQATAIARPEGLTPVVYNFSFPSGHAALATVFFLSLIFILRHDFPDLFSKRLFHIVAIGMIILVAISRLYLAVHWLSDCVGGILLGLFIFFFSLYIYKKVGMLVWHRGKVSAWQR